MASVVDEPAQAPAPAESRPEGPEQTYYECGGGRKTFYALAFIILLPFFISLPVMLTQRIMKGVWLDTWGLMVIAVGFTLIMMLVLFELVFSLTAKVDIGSEAVAITLPRSGGGLAPTLLFHSRTIPYSEIAAVQSYCDCYGGTLAPVVLRGSRLILKTGERIALGFVNDVDDDPRFPFKTIARQIAARAGLEVTDLGHVKYALHQRMFGKTGGAAAVMPPEAVADVNRGHGWFLTGVVVVVGLLLALGIINDFWHLTADWGERAVTE